MSTITTPRSSPVVTPASRPPITTVPGDQRIAFRGVGWHVYETLVDSIGEGQHVRVAYDGKDLEIMTTGYLHEGYKGLFGRVMDVVTEELDIPCLDAGQTTWKRPALERGLEADQCYYFDPKKLAVAAEAWARKSDEISDYPNPDLAIEIDISPSQINRPSIYAAMRVPEIWRFDGKNLVIEQLGANGQYAASMTSRYVPILPDEVLTWINAEDVINRTGWVRRLRAWIRAELLGRQAGPRKRPRRKK
jgi:Uma2 family endonuclease